MVRRALFSTVATACLKVPEFKGEFLVAVAVSIDTQAARPALAANFGPESCVSGGKTCAGLAIV